MVKGQSMSMKCQNLPKKTSKLLENVLDVYVYHEQNDSQWLPGNVEVDFHYSGKGFSAFFTDEGYGFRGEIPSDVTKGEVLTAAIIVFELGEVDYELPEKLK